MIVCTLDGKVAYPSTSEKIKVTYENQFVKDSGSYTYDITFPMSVAANREIFHNVQRFDVKKAVTNFETCRLFAGNRLVMSGKGIVMSITPDKVKIQIVGGKNKIKYNSKFEKHFIDEIDYPKVVLDSGVDNEMLQKFGYATPFVMGSQYSFLPIDLTKSNFVGQKGVAVLSPLRDETNERQINRVTVFHDMKMKRNGHEVSGDFHIMSNLAMQPYLLYILKKVMEYEGYSIVKNDLDKDPWNRLVIVSASRTGRVKDALPHWTVYKFIDELRKFFNASFVFDEVKKTVSISATNELLSNNTVSYDSEDDFSVEYDEDGLDNLTVSNIEYNFDDAANRAWQEYIPQQVFKQYETKEYKSFIDLKASIESMSDYERRTTIFKVNPNSWYVWAKVPKDWNPEAEETEWRLVMCGYFNPIIRDLDSDDSQQLNICPAAMYQRRSCDDAEVKIPYWLSNDKAAQSYVVIPSVTNDKDTSSDNMEEDENGDYYYTVQDAIEGSVSDSSSALEDDDDSRMPVAFQANCVHNTQSHSGVKYNDRLANENVYFRIPVLYTDYRMYSSYWTNDETASLSLSYVPTSGRVFGNLNRGFNSGSRFKNVLLDSHNAITIKFITDEIPDPAKIYIFRNKRYICEKVEMNVTNDGIDKEKTGYFYEIL